MHYLLQSIETRLDFFKHNFQTRDLHHERQGQQVPGIIITSKSPSNTHSEKITALSTLLGQNTGTPSLPVGVFFSLRTGATHGNRCPWSPNQLNIIKQRCSAPFWQAMLSQMGRAGSMDRNWVTLQPVTSLVKSRQLYMFLKTNLSTEQNVEIQKEIKLLQIMLWWLKRVKWVDSQVIA